MEMKSEPKCSQSQHFGTGNVALLKRELTNQRREREEERERQQKKKNLYRINLAFAKDGFSIARDRWIR